MRAGQFLDGLSRTFEVDLVVVLVAAVTAELDAFVAARVRRYRMFAGLRSDTHYDLISRVSNPEARLEAFEAYGRPSLTSVLTPDLLRDIEQWTAAERYGAVHIMRLYLAPIAQIWLAQDVAVRPVVTLDCDENEAETHRSLARCHRRMGQAARARWVDAEARAFDRLANGWVDRFDRVFFSSPDDARAVPGARHVANTSNMPSIVRRRRAGSSFNLLFLGTLSYAPNTEAVLWFARRVWPMLMRARDGALRCWLVGPEPTGAIRRLARCGDFRITGTVDDVAEYYARADLVVVPVLSGGGTRIKVIEGAAFGVPIVATPMGAKGLDLRDGRDILIAGSAPQFAKACLRLMGEEPYADALAGRAKSRARRLYDRRRWARRIGEGFADLVEQGSRGSRRPV